MAKWLIATITALMGFAAGALASQPAPASVRIRGVVMSANTIPEEVEYWEVRASANDSIVISGRRELPLVAWLRRASGKTILVTAEPAN